MLADELKLAGIDQGPQHVAPEIDRVEISSDMFEAGELFASTGGSAQAGQEEGIEGLLRGRLLSEELIEELIEASSGGPQSLLKRAVDEQVHRGLDP
jgi:hypothetical protein